MIGLNNLKPAKGSRHRRKIIGRGEGSGHGGTATRGMKGQKSRSGDGYMTGFEGGQMPLLRRIPKRGFNNRNKISYSIVNVEMLDKYFDSGSQVTKETLKEKGIIRNNAPVRILGNGEIKNSLTVKAESASKSAQDKIKAAGGSFEAVK